MGTQFQIVIPCRLGSTRLPGKVFMDETGKTMLEHVYGNCRDTGLHTVVLVEPGLDDKDIPSLISRGVNMAPVGGVIINGTERASEFMHPRHGPDFPVDNDVVIIVQADEPEVTAKAILALAEAMKSEPQRQWGTLCTKLSEGERGCMDIVKFTESIGTFSRGGHAVGDKRHVGVYAYRVRMLKMYADLEPSCSEIGLGLEQMRMVDAGIMPAVIDVDPSEVGYSVNTQEDYDDFVKRYKEK